MPTPDSEKPEDVTETEIADPGAPPLDDAEDGDEGDTDGGAGAPPEDTEGDEGESTDEAPLDADDEPPAPKKQAEAVRKEVEKALPAATRRASEVIAECVNAQKEVREDFAAAKARAEALKAELNEGNLLPGDEVQKRRDLNAAFDTMDSLRKEFDTLNAKIDGARIDRNGTRAASEMVLAVVGSAPELAPHTKALREAIKQRYVSDPKFREIADSIEDLDVDEESARNFAVSYLGKGVLAKKGKTTIFGKPKPARRPATILDAAAGGSVAPKKTANAEVSLSGMGQWLGVSEDFLKTRTPEQLKELKASYAEAKKGSSKK